MERTADFHHNIPDTFLPQPEPVFDNTTALHTAVDVLDPQPAVVQCLIGQLLFQAQLLTGRFLGWHEDLHVGQCEGQKAQILQQLTPGR
jgi:hypothetical protein